jgi:YggT family protein
MDIVDIIRALLIVYEVIVLVRVFSSWFPVPHSGPFRVILNVVYDLTEPILGPLRRMLPPVRMGMVAMDLSPIIVFIVISVVLASI